MLATQSDVSFDSRASATTSAVHVSSKVKVLYILGAGRSGTTLLGRLLGQVNGFFSMGELRWIWPMVYGEDVLCGCGIRFRNCPFWTTVFRRASVGMDTIDTRMEQFSGLHNSGLRQRWLPHLLCPRLSRAYREDLEHYSRNVSVICRAASEVSGCRVLIDTSKLVQQCIVLNRIQEIDLHVVHLVRDSRAVAYSWLRKKQRPQFYSRQVFMPQLGMMASAREWLVANGLSEALRPFLKRYTRIYYDDLAADPRATLLRICSTIGEPTPNLDFLDGRTAHLGKAHTVAGNPMRFQEGPVHIKPDMEWASNLSKGQTAIVAAITWPLMMYYSYSRQTRRSS